MFIYYIFIFIVGVILRSLLIAQFSTSYEEERGRAHVLVTIIQTRLLLRMETVPWIKPLLKVRPIDHVHSASAMLILLVYLVHTWTVIACITLYLFQLVQCTRKKTPKLCVKREETKGVKIHSIILSRCFIIIGRAWFVTCHSTSTVIYL